jgi:hypothetical protein
VHGTITGLTLSGNMDNLGHVLHGFRYDSHEPLAVTTWDMNPASESP